MTIWQSIFLGLLQGLTEFLPISSSGHLILAEKIMGVSQDMFTNVMLHIGTLLAVCIVMRKYILQTLTDKRKLLRLIIATLPTLVIAAVVKFALDDSFLNSLVPIGFAVTICLLLAQHFFVPKKCTLAPTSLLVTGIVQGIAVLPGVSRSGSTICTMCLFGIDKKEAANFSFLMSVPIILGAAGVEVLQLIFSQETAEAVATVPTEWYCVVVAVVVSFVAAFFSLKFMLKIVEKAKLWVFALYLLIPLVVSFIVL